MLETYARNLVRKYKHIFGFIKYTFQYQSPFNFVDVIFFSKKSAVLCKNGTFTQRNSVEAVLQFF